MVVLLFISYQISNKIQVTIFNGCLAFFQSYVTIRIGQNLPICIYGYILTIISFL